MDSQIKRNSAVIKNLREKRDLLETQRTRTSMLLAAHISKAIKNKGWTKSEFAEKLKKKPSVITRWLSGTHNFTSDTLSDIQAILGIKLLFTEEENSGQRYHLTLEVIVKNSSSEQESSDMIANSGGMQATRFSYTSTN